MTGLELLEQLSVMSQAELALPVHSPMGDFWDPAGLDWIEPVDNYGEPMLLLYPSEPDRERYPPIVDVIDAVTP